MKKIEEEKSFVKETETTRDYEKQQERERERDIPSACSKKQNF